VVGGWGTGGGHRQPEGADNEDPGRKLKGLPPFLLMSSKHAVIVNAKAVFQAGSGSDEREAQRVRFKLSTGS